MGYRQGYYHYHVFHTLVVTFSNWQGCVWIMNYYQNKYPNYALTKRRIVSELLAVVILIFIIVIIHCILLNILYGAPFKWQNIPHFMTTNALITLFAGVFYESRYFFERWNETFVETQRLRRQTTQSQLEVLKNQVNPHFLFNSLNTLLTLIPEDKQTAKKFTRKLGAVYQYILQYQNQELTTLDQEFNFIKSYLFLQQMRFGENLKARIEIDREYQAYQIVPLSLQMLVENAIKHNVVSSARPLYIDISNQGENLVVSNNLQLKSVRQMVAKNSTKIGLKNIQNRYRFFTQSPIEINAKNDCFEVKIPLLLPKEAAKPVVESLTTFVL
ncbi:hypothetical protein BKI52_04910 [marine bacterium AO1-C]|nr:hypothetical protein BKI52_04910 [marine bacterium AO1-C]